MFFPYVTPFLVFLLFANLDDSQALSNTPLLDPSTTIFGPGSEVLLLCTAKRCCVDKTTTVNLFAGTKQGEKVKKKWSRLMYGKEVETKAPDNLNISTDLGGLGEALSRTTNLVILNSEEPLPLSSLETLLGEDSTPILKDVVMVTRIGTSSSSSSSSGGGGGLFSFVGGVDSGSKYRECEESTRDIVNGRGLKMSTVRVGVMKGGGPGKIEEGKVVGEDLGLDKVFYDGQAQLEKFMMMSGHDKFTLGCSLTPNDPIKMSNPIIQSGRSVSFDPFPDEVNVITVAETVRLLRGRDVTVDATVSGEKGERLPTKDEFEVMFRKCEK